MPIHFERDETGKVILKGKNMDLLFKYVIPIIENNNAWGVTFPTAEDVRKDPEKWRVDIDSTVGDKPNYAVFIAMHGERPVGLLEYELQDTRNLTDKNYRETLTSLISDRNDRLWNTVVELGLVTEGIIEKFFPDLKDYIYSKKLYKGIGVVLIPELQGKRSGISDLLYRKMANGFLFGWTSTPQALAKRRKLFPYTLFFPVLDEKIDSIEGLACLALVASYITRGEMPYGVRTHPLFTIRDKGETMGLAKSFLEREKITEIDYRRLDSILNYRQAQGAIVSVS